MSKRIDTQSVEGRTGSAYPSPFDEPCNARERKRLGDVAGLTQFGVNLLSLPPGSWSSQRHWHTRTDEFIYVLSGEVTLQTDDGEEILRVGDAAGFKAGEQNGHCIKNLSDQPAQVLEIGTRVDTDAAHYSDIDLLATIRDGQVRFTRNDGSEFK